MGDASGRETDPGGNARTAATDVDRTEVVADEGGAIGREPRSDGADVNKRQTVDDVKPQSKGKENGEAVSEESRKTEKPLEPPPLEAQNSKEPSKQNELMKTPDEVKKTDELTKSDAEKKPDDVQKADESMRPAVTKKPEDSMKTSETKKSDESMKTNETKKSDESVKTNEIKKSDESMKTSETKKPDESMKPEEQKPPRSKDKLQKKSEDKAKTKTIAMDDQQNKVDPRQPQEVVAKGDEEKNDDQTLQEPPIAPPRRSPARRKRLLGKRIRKRTGGETGDGVRKLDPTTSEEEADAERPNERKVDQWRREDEEKKKKDEKRDKEKKDRDELEQHEIEEWTRRFQEAKRKMMEPDEPVKRDGDDAKDIPKDAVTEEKEEVIPRWKFWKRATKKKEVKDKTPKKETKDVAIKQVEEDKASVRLFSREARLEYARFKRDNWDEWERIKQLWNKCMGEIFLVVMLCGAGAFIFRFTEGAFENFYKCGVKRVKRDFVDELWRGSTYLKEEEWKSRARRKLMEMEQQLEAAFDAGVSSYSGHKSWSFINSLVYSLTVITTIGTLVIT